MKTRPQLLLCTDKMYSNKSFWQGFLIISYLKLTDRRFYFVHKLSGCREILAHILSAHSELSSRLDFRRPPDPVCDPPGRETSGGDECGLISPNSGW